MKTNISKENIGFALLVVSSFVSFLSVFWGIDLKDTFYMGCLFIENSPMPMHQITQFLYVTIVNIFGDRIIFVRVFNWFLFYFSILLVYFVGIQKSKRNYASCIILSVCVLLIPLLETNVFNGNSLTVLNLTCFYICVYKNDGDSLFLDFVEIVFLCLAILSRLPNIVVLPFLLISTPLIKYKNFKSMLRQILIICVVLAAVAIVDTILFDGFDNYYELLTIAMASESSHSISVLLNVYINAIKDVVSDIKYLTIVFALFIFCFLVRKKLFRIVSFILSLVLLCYLIIKKVNIITPIIPYHISVFVYAITVLCLFINCAICILKLEYGLFGKQILLFLVSMTCAAGSDTGIYLAMMPAVILFPIVFVNMIGLLSSCKTGHLMVVIVMLFVLSFCSLLYCRSQIVGVICFSVSLGCFIVLSLINNNSILCFGRRFDLNLAFFSSVDKKSIYKCSFVLCTIIVPIAIFHRYNTVFWDKPINDLKYEIGIEQLHHIRTSKESFAYVENVMKYYDELVDNGYERIVFFGSNSFVFSYVTHIGIIQGTDFLQEHNEKNEDAVMKSLIECPAIIVCNSDFYNNNVYQAVPKTPIEKKIIDKGYVCEEKEECRIYYPYL